MSAYVCTGAVGLLAICGVYYATTEQWGWLAMAAVGTFFWLLNLWNAVRRTAKGER